ncbi:hypothetical protein T09_13108 [Trichinella sp. T9]|nr:hypothetical protein T09_13108 [Trichinella sp. T9]
MPDGSVLHALPGHSPPQKVFDFWFTTNKDILGYGLPLTEQSLNL